MRRRRGTFEAGQEGFEPPTAGFGDRCSTCLSYCPPNSRNGFGDRGSHIDHSPEPPELDHAVGTSSGAGIPQETVQYMSALRLRYILSCRVCNRHRNSHN
jgi:hypothetical protein